MGAAQTNERKHYGEDRNTKLPVRNDDRSRLEAELAMWEYKISKLNAMLVALESGKVEGYEEHLAKLQRCIHIQYALLGAMERRDQLLNELRNLPPFRMPSIFWTSTQSVVDSHSYVDIPEQETFLPSKKCV